MEFSVKLHAIKLGWSIVYNEGSQVIISKNVVFDSLMNDFVSVNSADLDEMPWHFTVCQSTRFGVSGPQEVKCRTTLPIKQPPHT